MNKRKRNKILKIVARQINNGDFAKLKPVHFRCVDKFFDGFLNSRYDHEFRPWWYAQDWAVHKLSPSLARYQEKWNVELQELTGINIELYRQYFQLNHCIRA